LGENKTWQAVQLAFPNEDLTLPAGQGSHAVLAKFGCDPGLHQSSHRAVVKLNKESSGQAVLKHS
jgi:hypothetical protein